MATQKKSRKKFIIAVVVMVIAYFLFGRTLISNWKLKGTWNGTAWADILNQYPGISVSVLGNQVTVPGRDDISPGTLTGNTIIWKNGASWSRT